MIPDFCPICAEPIARVGEEEDFEIFVCSHEHRWKSDRRESDSKLRRYDAEVGAANELVRILRAYYPEIEGSGASVSALILQALEWYSIDTEGGAESGLSTILFKLIEGAETRIRNI